MITIATFIILAITLYFYTARTFKYWKIRGVKHDKPIPIFGERLALMQSLDGLMAILAKFTVEPVPETLRHSDISTKTGMLQGFIGGLPLLFRERPNAI